MSWSSWPYTRWGTCWLRHYDAHDMDQGSNILNIINNNTNFYIHWYFIDRELRNIHNLDSWHWCLLTFVIVVSEKRRSGKRSSLSEGTNPIIVASNRACAWRLHWDWISTSISIATRLSHRSLRHPDHLFQRLYPSQLRWLHLKFIKMVGFLTFWISKFYLQWPKVDLGLLVLTWACDHQDSGIFLWKFWLTGILVSKRFLRSISLTLRLSLRPASTSWR